MSEKKRTIIDTLASSHITPIALGFLVVAIWFFGSLTLYKHYFVTKPEWAGQFGDMFGMVNSLFSGLAFAGLIYAIILQRKELSLTRDELELTREEFRKQNINLKRQRFESTLFSMIEIHLNNLRSLQYKNEFGTRAIGQFIASVTSRLKDYPSGSDKHQDRINVYNDVFINGQFTNIVSPYIKSLTAIFEVVKNSSLSENAEKRYMKILKSYISNVEVEFLFYHNTFCHHDDLTEKELSLLDKFMTESGLISEARSYILRKRDFNF